MALLMVMTVCLLVYAALEYRIRTVLKEHEATFPDQKGKRIQHPTARWVFHYFVGIHVLFIPGQGLMILNLTDKSTSTSSNSWESGMLGFITKNAPKSEPLCGMSVTSLPASSDGPPGG